MQIPNLNILADHRGCISLPVAAAPSGSAHAADVTRVRFEILIGTLNPLPKVCRIPGQEEPPGGGSRAGVPPELVWAVEVGLPMDTALPLSPGNPSS